MSLDPLLDVEVDAICRLWRPSQGYGFVRILRPSIDLCIKGAEMAGVDAARGDRVRFVLRRDVTGRYVPERLRVVRRAAR